MIIVLNGYPGVGKLTIARALAPMLRARLLDIHTVYNVAFALTEFRSPAFWKTVDQIEAISHALIRDLPPDVPVILTTVLTNKSAREQAEWHKIAGLGQSRPPFCVVHIGCVLDENIRRIGSEERGQRHKPRDPEMAVRNQAAAEPLAGLDAANLLKLDTTVLSPDASAGVIAEWLSDV